MSYQTPGVKIKEIASLPSSVVQVSTAVPVILGYTEIGAKMKPVRISSLSEYGVHFGGPYKYKYAISTAGVVTLAKFGPTASAKDYPKAGTFFLYEAMQMYFANGGGPCYIMPVGNFPAAVATAVQSVVKADFGDAQSGALAEIQKLDEPTLILFPEASNLAMSDYKSIVEAGLTLAADMQDRFTLIDTPQGLDLTDPIVTGGTTKLDDFRTALGTGNLKYGATYYPFLETSLAWTWDADKCTYDGKTLNALKTAGNQDYNVALDILAATASLNVVLPPSSAIAGVYAKTDNDRGVWVAPANVSLQSVNNPAQAISEGMQKLLNVDAMAGKSINAIRSFTGKGTLVWGARTLAGNDNEWRYVPVRRLFLTAEESIRKATEPFVFAPNDARTWVKVSSMVASYLDGLWRQGALMGAKPEDAYFVKVGLGTTMTEQNVLDGEMIIEVGLAAVRPAEFIVINFRHHFNQ